MHSLSDKAGFLIVANLFKYAVGFVMPMVLVRLLEQQEYGTYQQLLLVSTAAAGIMTLGLPTSIYYFYHHVSADRRPALIFQTSLMLAISGMICAGLIYLASPYIADRMSNPGLTGLLNIYVIYIAFFIAGEYFVHLLISQDRYRIAVGFEAGETAVRVMVLVIPLWLGYGLAGLVWAAIIYAGLRLAVRTILVFSGDTGTAGTWTKSPFPLEQLHYSIPLALTSFVGLVGGLLDKAIIAAFFTPVHYAIYSVGALEIPLDVIFQASVANVLRASFPPLVRDGNMAELVRIWREAVRKLGIIVLPSFVFLLGFSYDFITLLFTSKYAESVHVFRIYLFMMPLHMFVFSLIPQVFGKTRYNLYIVVIATAVKIALSFIFLETIGFYGPAMATVIVAYMTIGIYFVVAARLVNTNAWRLLPWASLGKISVATAVSLGMAYSLRGVTDIKWLDLVVCSAAYSGGFLLLGALFGVFTEDDRNLARRWISRILPVNMR